MLIKRKVKMNKGVVISYLCTNPSCSYSEEKLIIKKPVTFSNKGGCKFEGISTCPKCKSSIELLHFISGEVEITEDKI